MRMRWKALLALALVCFFPALSRAATGHMGALLLNRDAPQPAMDLDGDGLYDVIEYIAPANQSILRFRFGNGFVLGYSLGNSEQTELVKIDAADITSNGVRELIMMACDPSDQSFTFHVLQIRETGFRALPVPVGQTDAAYCFEATLLRGHMLEIKNADESFLFVHTLDAQTHPSLFREDGSVRTQEIRVSAFQNFTVVPYTAGYAVEYKQAVSYGANDIILGYIVSSLVWRGGEAFLVEQRFDPV